MGETLAAVGNAQRDADAYGAGQHADGDQKIPPGKAVWTFLGSLQEDHLALPEIRILRIIIQHPKPPRQTAKTADFGEVCLAAVKIFFNSLLKSLTFRKISFKLSYRVLCFYKEGHN